MFKNAKKLPLLNETTQKYALVRTLINMAGRDTYAFTAIAWKYQILKLFTLHNESGKGDHILSQQPWRDTRLLDLHLRNGLLLYVLKVHLCEMIVGWVIILFRCTFKRICSLLNLPLQLATVFENF